MEEIKEEILELLDNSVKDMSQEDYRDTLSDIITDLECRLDAVNNELE